MKKKPSYRDSVRGKEKITPVPSDITGGLGAYTANQTWIVGAFRSGTWIRQRIKYSFGALYANVNLSFYHVYPLLGEKGYEFNFRTIPIFLQAIKRLGISPWGMGIKYLFLKTKIGNADSLPSFVKSNEINSTVSQLGAVVEFDNRDNIFTPDNGLKIHVDGIRSDQVLEAIMISGT